MGYKEMGTPSEMKLIKVFEGDKMIKEYSDASLVYCFETGYGTNWDGFAITDKMGCYDIYKKPQCHYEAVA